MADKPDKFSPERMGIERTSRKVTRVETMPKHGHKRTRVITKDVSLPRIRALDRPGDGEE